MPPKDWFGGHHIEFIYNVVRVTHLMIPANIKKSTRILEEVRKMGGNFTNKLA